MSRLPSEIRVPGFRGAAKVAASFSPCIRVLVPELRSLRFAFLDIDECIYVSCARCLRAFGIPT